MLSASTSSNVGSAFGITNGSEPWLDPGDKADPLICDDERLLFELGDKTSRSNIDFGFTRGDGALDDSLDSSGLTNIDAHTLA